MMMTEKYYTLPPSSSSSSPSSFYHSTKTKSIREFRARLYASRKSPSEMKLPIEQQQQQPLIRTYDVQDRIDYFEKKKQFDDECKEKGKNKLNFSKKPFDISLCLFNFQFLPILCRQPAIHCKQLLLIHYNKHFFKMNPMVVHFHVQ